MKRRVIIIHGCSSAPEEKLPETRTYDKHWIPWIEKELLARNIAVETPLMPSPWAPDFEEWRKKLNQFLIDKDTVLVGHSCGAAFLVRWLGEEKREISKLILVAPWKISEGGKKNFYDYPVDESIKSRIDEITMFTADNEEKAGKESLMIFQQSLKGRVIELEGRGHYTFDEMKTEEFPELLEEIVR
ncbi:MAG: alpha/beta hydrolase [Anaplasmataceae bacterium]|nr:alpha/beta hydrolase [Anaplasmataceae bacterium]